MTGFTEKAGEKQGQRTKRFLKYLRDLPMPKGKYDPKTNTFIPAPEKGKKE